MNKELRKALKEVFNLKHIILIRINKKETARGRYIDYTITFSTRNK